MSSGVLSRVDPAFKNWLNNYKKQFARLGYNFSDRQLTRMVPTLLRWSNIKDIPKGHFDRIVGKARKKGDDWW